MTAAGKEEDEEAVTMHPYPTHVPVHLLLPRELELRLGEQEDGEGE